MKHIILYLGGFQLPEKNAAAQRVIGIAKGFRNLGYQVFFLNSIKGYTETGVVEKEYFGFKCFEYKKENEKDYLFSARTALSLIRKVNPYAVIAYNYPAVALERIRKYCKKNEVRCFADSTEWYDTVGRNIIVKLVKGFDTSYRMKYVHKRLDGVIAISRYLFDYYKNSVKTVLIPPTIDIEDNKWNIPAATNKDCVSFVYAGVPSVTKEKLDRIVSAIGRVEKKTKVCLNVVGITKEQFVNLYAWKKDLPESVIFWGRVEHKKALQIVGCSNWSIILREDNRTVKAGFPTKLAESLSCGTPVLANRFSNIFDYLTEENSICVENTENIEKYILKACEKKCVVDNTVFDYHKYLQELEMLCEEQ